MRLQVAKCKKDFDYSGSEWMPIAEEILFESRAAALGYLEKSANNGEIYILRGTEIYEINAEGETIGAYRLRLDVRDHGHKGDEMLMHLFSEEVDTARNWGAEAHDWVSDEEDMLSPGEQYDTLVEVRWNRDKWEEV